MDTVITRSRWVLGFFIFALSICAVRLVQLQIIEGPSLAAQGQRVRTSSTEVAAARGTITDATGVVLANSIQTYDIAVNQVNIRAYVHRDDDGNEVGRGPAEAARQLAPLLGMNEAELGGMMLGDSTYVYIKRNVDAVSYREIRKLDIYGIEWESVFEREYPNGNVAAPVIGTVNAEGQGSSGMEAQFDALLTGTPGAQAFEIAPNGAVMPGGKKTTVEPKNGGNVELTMHADLQHQVQDLLDARVAKHHADWGAVVIEDVATGHVLVMADSNSTEPDNAKPQKVHAVQDVFEPGSMGKLVTVGVALNQGTISPTSVFQVPYALDLPDAGGPITDFHEHDGETLTATGVLAESSNTGTILHDARLRVWPGDRYRAAWRICGSAAQCRPVAGARSLRDDVRSGLRDYGDAGGFRSRDDRERGSAHFAAHREVVDERGWNGRGSRYQPARAGHGCAGCLAAADHDGIRR